MADRCGAGRIEAGLKLVAGSFSVVKRSALRPTYRRMNLRFHHSVAEKHFWRSLARRALKLGQPTPCYIFSVDPLKVALRELEEAFSGLPVRHWLSCKTQPLKPMLRWWRELGRPIEVVSEYEFRAALAEGFPPERILVNGPAKHRWMPEHAVEGLWVNFDSPRELKALAGMARRLKWRVGLRLRTGEEYDPESRDYPTQFGFEHQEVAAALRLLKRQGLAVEVLHFHLRTNVAGAAGYGRAVQEVRDLCESHSLKPAFMDCGGGFPPPNVFGIDGRSVNGSFQLKQMARLYRDMLKWFPSCREIWLENGRWMSARSGILLVTVVDSKEKNLRTRIASPGGASGRKGKDGKGRHLICDGGRTMNALVSNWEAHELLSLPERSGRKIMTTVNGPTCMAFDKLARRPLPRSIRVGDRLLWLDAGAYHLSWETRFSHGLATVLWHDGRELISVRTAEPFVNWWSGT